MSATPAGDDAVNGDSASRFCQDFDAVFKDRKVSFRQAAELSGWSKSTIERARRGHGLPKAEVVRDVLEAIGLSSIEVDAWMSRRDRIAAGESVTEAAQVEMVRPPQSPSRRRWLLLGGIAAGLAVGLVIGLVFAFGADEPGATDGTATDPPAGSREIVVQNKVAIGAVTLEEDDSPSYLSSRTVSRCADIGCKVTGTDVYSGAKLTAYCQASGEWLTNADLESEGIKQNPGLVASDLWYGIEWRDGRRGFISAIYIEPSYRGGLGLPAC